jgi:16S rRNA (guanine1516-N2)-methyltransferase
MNRPTRQQGLCVICDSESRYAEAEAFALAQGLTLLHEHTDACALQLRFGVDRIELFDTALDTGVHVDFISGALAHRRQFGGGRGQAIARAVGLKHGITPTLLDVTAGLARDACILASLGCTVSLVERSPVLYTLIRDGIQRGLAAETSADVLGNFMNLVNADATLYLDHLPAESKPDVIYMDPMYPERKKSALVKKDMQILQHLLTEPDDASKLFNVSLVHARKRVVVKRPIHADALAGPAPSVSISSRKTRYDVYVNEAF